VLLALRSSGQVGRRPSALPAKLRRKAEALIGAPKRQRHPRHHRHHPLPHCAKDAGASFLPGEAAKSGPQGPGGAPEVLEHGPIVRISPIPQALWWRSDSCQQQSTGAGMRVMVLGGYGNFGARISPGIGGVTLHRAAGCRQGRALRTKFCGNHTGTGPCPWCAVDMHSPDFSRVLVDV